MRKLKEYRVIQGTTVKELSHSVNTWISAGFEPIGGIAIEHGTMMQAMAKWERTDPDQGKIDMDL